MGGQQQPFLYEADRISSRYPESPFDPKAVTRASWEPKPVKPKPQGPLLGLNRHPDAHEVIGGRRQNHVTMSSLTKAWIKGMRVVQLLMRVLQFVAATGILVLVILISHMPDLTTWVLRITAGFVIIHAAYGIYHLSKPAGYRTPASSGAYQVFSAFSDLVVILLYVYGVLAVRNDSADWSTLLSDTDAVPYLETAFYYTLIGAGGLHAATFAVALWLAVKFRQITLMPPDMNPLESRFTSRAKKQQPKERHARNKSSVATADTFESLSSLDNDKNLLSRPPTVPFLHTRTGSDMSQRTRDSRLDLPSRQYQTSPANSARNSMVTLKRTSATTITPTNDRGSYTEVPLHARGYGHAPSTPSHRSGRSSDDTRFGSRPNSGTPNGRAVHSGPGTPTGLGIVNGTSDGSTNGRQAKFTESWYASESLVNRTQQRNKALNTLVLNATGKRRNYEVVNQAYDLPESDGEGSDTETVHHHTGVAGHGEADGRYDDYDYGAQGEDDTDIDPQHPNPLRSNPPPPTRVKTPFRRPDDGHALNRPLSTAPTVSSMTSSVHTNTTNGVSVLSEVNINDRRVSGGYTADIADARNNKANQDRASAGRDLTAAAAALSPPQESQPLPRKATKKRWTWAPRSRESSIQPDSSFFSKPYGAIKPATPPILVGQDLSTRGDNGRQVSSGNDYDLGSGLRTTNNVGGGGDRYLYYGSGENGAISGAFGRRNVSGKIAEEGRAFSRYSMLNDD
ncbi:hypothetical protein SPI_00725 [Niveomyces insectorum RCEF 264]|uniref:Uncharacterized protein n=1 Tax=Niveomyces insectorum RCEF 264 TaxID=1081102 RepID=A0A168ABP0_9HYPO|nr:hypothetical protein SPI_00725 [Niveomyces insectorum RCEF 264]